MFVLKETERGIVLVDHHVVVVDHPRLETRQGQVGGRGVMRLKE
jgi:hypothetical protein